MGKALTRRSWYAWVVAIAVAAILFAGGAWTKHASAASVAGFQVPAGVAANAWWCDTSRPWVAGKRADNWSGLTGGLGEAAPVGTHVQATANNFTRTFRVFLYSPVSEGFAAVAYADIQLEPGSTYPTGAMSPTSAAVYLTYQRQDNQSDGMLKIWFVQWDGGSGTNNQLWRIYTNCYYNDR